MEKDATSLNQSRTWKRVTPIPLEFNGNGYLYECRRCHKVTTYLGGKDYPPYECECRREEKKNE